MTPEQYSVRKPEKSHLKLRAEIGGLLLNLTREAASTSQQVKRSTNSKKAAFKTGKKKSFKTEKIEVSRLEK